VCCVCSLAYLGSWFGGIISIGVEISGILKIWVLKLRAMVMSSRSGATFRESEVQYSERSEQNFLLS